MFMDLLQLFLGQIPEAIFFALFMIFTKQLKEKRALFVVLMVVEYLLLKTFIKFDMWFQIGYTLITYIILKILYKDKAQIIDVFTFTIASFILILISTISYLIIWKTINIFIVSVILNRLLMIIFFIFMYRQLPKLQTIYKKFWNRDRTKQNKIKATTFRALNVVVFNIVFYIINLCMLFTSIIGRGV